MELPNKFNSTENEHIKLSFYSDKNGKIKYDHFLNRSPAVAGLVFAITEGDTKVLIGKRSKKMFDSPGSVGIPCGYVNWDETLHNAMMREVYEETSFYMPDYEEQLVFSNDKFPFMIKDKPSEKHQNITSVFISVFNFEDVNNEFMNKIENFTCNESEWIRWMPMMEFFETYHKLSWAFNHHETINKGWELWKNLIYNK